MINSAPNTLHSKVSDYIALTRFNRPIGSYLLLWPTLWALWLAAKGIADVHLIIIFTVGTFLMRSAGCAINDYADRGIDAHVKRTAERPLAAGRITAKEALMVATSLALLAFVLVLMTNLKTILLSFVAVALAACYPFMKRYTHFPQVVLGAAFSWGIPMAFTAQTNELPQQLWLVYITALLWTVAYDTFYAMTDREDDLKIGVKSTAIIFGDHDRLITAILQVLVIILLVLVGLQFQLNGWYFFSLLGASALFIYQQVLIRHRDRDQCFKAFLNNHWVGAIIFAGIFLSYFLES